MNVLILGSGAREHALAWKLRQSPRIDDLFVAPGNPGTTAVATNLSVDLRDFAGLVRAVQAHQVELVVVGPEDPLAAGIADYLMLHGILVYGPTRAAARIESSKAFGKQVMARAGIQTAAATMFDDYETAAAAVRAAPAPPVIKADGLAAGKGVTVATSHEEALQAVWAAVNTRVFGEAGRHVLVEERLVGRELSAHLFTDGLTVLPMPYARDHKAIFDGGLGPNTGGMGAYSAGDCVSTALAEEIERNVMRPAVRTLAALGSHFRGTLYPGLMLTAAGPRVIEFNCRFGDPETEVIVPRLASDLFEPLWGVVTNTLDRVSLNWSADACVGVVLASGGYPGPYDRGEPITGLAEIDPNVQVFHAGTALDRDGRLVTAGGRVLTVVARGASLEAARRMAYDNVARIHFAGCHYRHDIGLDEANEGPGTGSGGKQR